MNSSLAFSRDGSLGRLWWARTIFIHKFCKTNMISGASESAETLSWTSKGLTAFILPQFVNYNTVTCDI